LGSILPRSGCEGRRTRAVLVLFHLISARSVHIKLLLQNCSPRTVFLKMLLRSFCMKTQRIWLIRSLLEHKQSDVKDDLKQ
ncbi:hypothetical protein J4Q44_G00187150, partial [Coregonus suidteri]